MAPQRRFSETFFGLWLTSVNGSNTPGHPCPPTRDGVKKRVLHSRERGCKKVSNGQRRKRHGASKAFILCPEHRSLKTEIPPQERTPTGAAVDGRAKAIGMEAATSGAAPNRSGKRRKE